MAFKDRFSSVSASYKRHRPSYPDELFDYLASIAPRRQLVWDCATGNGQAAVGLAKLFDKVIATDASQSQLDHAEARQNIDYRRATAEHSGLTPSSIDLITVATAAHWLDLDRFYEEVRRVARPDAVIAVWAYQVLRPEAEIDHPLQAFHDAVHEHWQVDRSIVDHGYRDLHFPFEEIQPPKFQIQRQLTREQLLGYLGTSSAARNMREKTGIDPVDQVRQNLEQTWPANRTTLEFTWPIGLRVGKVNR